MISKWTQVENSRNDKIKTFIKQRLRVLLKTTTLANYETTERTEIWSGLETISRKSFEVLSRAKVTSDYCHDSKSPLILVTTEQYFKMIKQLKAKGIRQRFVTEITQENVKYSKELACHVELRHLQGVKGNFGIVDGKEYGAAANIYDLQPPVEFIYSNVKTFVEQQQYFFETLWNKAIPAEQRIKEIEEGIEPEVIETIREPKATQDRVFELLKSAKEEILIIFSTSNAFRRQEKAGAVDLVIRTAKSKNVKVRILSPFDEYVTNLIDKIKKEEKIRIEIRSIKEPLQTKVSVMIVDRRLLLSAELKNDSKETSLEAIV